MLQELFRIPGFDLPVYGYGLMLVIGFLLGTQLAKFLARRCGYDGEAFVNGCLIGLVAGVVGARLSHVLESLADSTNHEFARNGETGWSNFKSMLNVSSGGLTFYGGFLLATPVLILYAIHKRIPVLKGMDIIAPCLMVGLAFGRVGCYLNGCCYGEECSLPWGAAFPYGSNAFVEQYAKGEIDVPAELTDPTHLSGGRSRLLSKEEVHKAHLDDVAKTVRARPVHPTELYSAFNAGLIVAALMAYFSLSPSPGRVFAMMLMLKGVSRFTLEMIRVEPPVLGKMSFSMVVSVGLVIVGILMWLLVGMGRRRSGERLTGVAPAM